MDIYYNLFNHCPIDGLVVSNFSPLKALFYNITVRNLLHVSFHSGAFIAVG